ncbi:MAG: DNA polymerase/3'-5' exonuclease PolX [Deltaproteobacteria bacterium]|nr:DNA polymerase/3'-5' exonuclease PolX [Deltaproteobacteria bacterium]
MEKNQIIENLNTIAQLMELDGENPFKVRAFLNAARVLESEARDLSTLVKTGELSNLQGVGKGLTEAITEMVQKNKSTPLMELQKKFPEGLVECLKISGLGPKKLKVLYQELGIQNVGELEYACKENRLLGLKGFGLKTQENVLQGIAALKKFQGRFHLDMAWATANRLVAYLKAQHKGLQIEVGGSLRRWRETIGDIDLLIASDNSAEKIIQTFQKVPQLESVLAAGPTKASIRLQSSIQVDLRVVHPEEFPYALVYFTGNKIHNTALRARAKDFGLKLNEYGLFKGTKCIPCKTEADVYAALELQYIPPELREGLGEIEIAAEHKIPKLIEAKDIQGVFHVHSDWSDGINAMEDMQQEAMRLGFCYMGQSDHSQSATYAGGLNETRVKSQLTKIEGLNKKTKNFHIFKGVESDILADGSLDYAPKILKQFDFIIASVHSRFKMTKSQMTERILTAIKNPYTRILGHMTGRLLLAREEYEIDIEKIIEEAAKNRVAIEINANPHRLDMDWRFLKKAKTAGVKFFINPDAHSTRGLSDTWLGVHIARKGWLSKEDVINTGSLAVITKYLSNMDPPLPRRMTCT